MRFAMLVLLLTWTVAELTPSETRPYAASLWEKAFPGHEDTASMTHAYRLLKVNGTVHALAYHQINLHNPLCSVDHYAWIDHRWVPRGPGLPGPTAMTDSPLFANLQDQVPPATMLGPLALKGWPKAISASFLDIKLVQEW